LSLQLAEGILQGATLFYGKGRVAVFGEAAMFSARVPDENGNVIDNNGINHPEALFNETFVLNTLGWLAEKTDVTCITLGDDISFTVPNLKLSGLKFAAKFRYDKDMNFKLDKKALEDADENAQEIGLNAEELTLPCININGAAYTVTFTSPNGNLVDWTLKDYAPVSE
ncbi:MAG: hypothetical protein HQK67_10910, partial [Desulfamplus sp.]|nr:hypothetical protein [Desulfamplus sp.]